MVMSEVSLEVTQKEKHILHDVSINVTANCNLKCTYCFYPNKQNEGMSKKTAGTVVRWIEENVIVGSRITFFGIEPMMNWKIVKKIINCLDGYEFDMTTNATLINEKVAKEISKLMVGVLVSWDGVPGTHNPYRSNSHNATLKGVHWLNSVGVKPAIACTVLPETILYLKENFEYMSGIADISSIHFNIVRDWETPWQWLWSTATREWWRLYKYVITSEIPEGFMAKWLEHKKTGKRLDRRCGAGVTTVGIDYRGTIWPCHRTTHWEKPIGDIGKQFEAMRHGSYNMCEMCTTLYCNSCWVQKPNADICKMIKIREMVLEKVWSDLLDQKNKD